jgi:hypothetical protein
MTTSFEQVVCYYQNLGLPCKFDETNHRLLSAIKTDNIPELLIVTQFAEDGRFLEIWMPGLLQISNDNVFKGPLLQTLATLHYETRLVRFAYNPSNGEIIASVELPLADAELTQNQLCQSLQLLLHLVDRSLPRLKTVLATGNDPGYKTKVDRLLEQLSDEELEIAVQKMLAMRQQKRHLQN